MEFLKFMVIHNKHKIDINSLNNFIYHNLCLLTPLFLANS